MTVVFFCTGQFHFYIFQVKYRAFICNNILKSSTFTGVKEVPLHWLEYVVWFWIWVQFTEGWFSLPFMLSNCTVISGHVCLVSQAKSLDFGWLSNGRSSEVLYPVLVIMWYEWLKDMWFSQNKRGDFRGKCCIIRSIQRSKVFLPAVRNCVRGGSLGVMVSSFLSWYLLLLRNWEDKHGSEYFFVVRIQVETLTQKHQLHI